MKRIIPFSKYFVPAAVVSILLTVSGVVGFLLMGFNLGVDFQAGLIQEVQFAPTAFDLTYNGPGNASISLTRTAIDIVISGAGIDEVTHRFAYAAYVTQGELARALRGVEGLEVTPPASEDAQSTWLIQSAQSNPVLDPHQPFVVHYLRPTLNPVRIEDVRSSLLPLGTVSVQVLGTPSERRFMIRMEDSELENVASVHSDRIINALENSFGRGEVAVTRSDYVGSRFSKQLTDQAGLLMSMTLLLILAYCTIRFRIRYAVGAVLAIIHDALIMVAFIVWTRMEFNTTTIAAILTILGYSINDTVVVFDRIKETQRIYPDDTFVTVLNRAISDTLSRTIITTVTTMLAVFSLFFFTTGSMKDFALALLVGMTSGVYSTIFIASGLVYLWDKLAKKREKKKQKLILARA
ncbi:MAG: protein translocase subunit SecF [Treponema sp.]|jgi:preprotein translocase subunit SecF|nr:protein translocase subunit SecF [Treponema sp.]